MQMTLSVYISRLELLKLSINQSELRLRQALTMLQSAVIVAFLRIL